MELRRVMAIEKRKSLGLSALALAEKADLRGEDWVFQVERGRYKATPEEAQRWADALGVAVADIFPDLAPPTEAAQ